MYKIRVKNNSNHNRYVNNLDQRCFTIDEAYKVFHDTIHQLQGLNTIVCLYDFRNDDLLEEQHC